MTDVQLPPDLRDAPPTARLCYIALREHGPATPPQLCEQTYIPERSLYRALRELDDAGHLVEHHDPTEPATCYYNVRAGD